MQARLAFLCAVVVVCLVAGGCDVDDGNAGGEAAATATLQSAGVMRVVDGDTLIVKVDGKQERLRYIGIDAPESVTPDQPVGCFGPEASDENARLVAGQTVYLEADVEDRDRYGRLLRYVYVRDANGELVMINALLVAGGYAEAGSYPPNERHSDELFSAEATAMEHRTGLWGACP